MGFILLWLFSVLMSIVNGQTCAAFFDYRGDWLPFGFCFNLWDASSGRSSMQFMCNTAKTNITRVFWDGFDCIGAQRFNFTDSYNNGYIPSYDPGSVFCQQDYPVCSTNQVAVVNAFDDVQQSQCDNNDFSGAIEFRQEYSSYALDMCFNYPSNHPNYAGESRLYTCNGLNVMRHRWNSAGCSGSPATITNAVTYPTCVPSDFDAVIQCGATANTLITSTWSLTNYPLDPTDSPTLPPVQSPIYNGSYNYNATDSYTTIFITLSPTPNTLAPSVAGCPEGCVRYYPDGCVQCLCQDGKYDLTTCTTGIECTSTGTGNDTIWAYCDLCDTDTQECNVGDDVERDEDNLCQFKQCKDPQGNGNSVYYICVMGNVIGIFILMILKMV